jgi:putative two-component system response regulator
MPVSQPTLLLIASHQQFIYLIKRYGERSGCRVIGAEKLETALDLARREHPAMLLLHLMATSHDDWSMVRRLKAALGDDAIPITVIAAVADETRAREEGAAYWLWQPVMYADFVAALTATGALRHPPSLPVPPT